MVQSATQARSESKGAAAANARASEVERAGVFSAYERRIALALAEAAMPSTTTLPGGGEATIARYENLVERLGPDLARAARAGLWAAEAWPVSRLGRPLTMMSREERVKALSRWAESPSRHERWLLRGVLTPLKSAHFDDAKMFEHVHCRRDVDSPKVAEVASWMQRVTDGRTVESDLELPCEAVVIGTGAGGAAMAYELAKRGRAVLLLEGGHFHSRTDFKGRASEAYERLYLGLGTSLAIGNVAVPILAGRGVGGSTTINSGTCYRAPAHTLARWSDRYGLTMHTAASLAPYYERVESMLGVTEAAREHLGGSARVIARGADLLQLSHKPLLRNAPACDGQGVCCFGCPTGAKRSTDVSYVPEALKRGAEMITGARVTDIHVEGGRARGVTARLASGRTLRVRADAVVVAGGALLTPLLLGKNDLCTRSGWLGKNLSIHPATKVMALFDEEIDMSRGIPQSYTIDSYAHDGLLFEGASTPFDVTAVAIPWVGDRFMEIMSRYPNIATFGLMIQDKSRGSVRLGPGGQPLIFYDLNQEDLAKMHRGMGILAEVFLRAGAKRVMPMIAGCEEIDDDAGLERLKSMRVRAGDFEVSAFHPLGTCRMGTDPTRSCVGPDGEAHDVAGLWVADGSVIPSSLGVNPQMTIMALALRSAEALDERLSRRSAAEASVFASLHGASDAASENGAKSSARQVAFEETMSGTYSLAVAPRERRPISFSLRARSRSLYDFTRTREVGIIGELLAEGFGARCPLEGTLTMDVMRTGKLRYDFRFTAEDGNAYRFVGEKVLKLLSLRRSMTWLPSKIFDASGAEIASAEVTFDLGRDLVSFLRSWRVSSQ